ncbi:hypothetical protein LMG27177_01946 [Paraburkholderia fynbosensis]|uniref:Uncharacterized protein n=1 Tax=Paraburkholderia fynbosensis TaxID=1200993 RepID=A0A6J5FXC1_9BURK|nr:hypothetical protein LMG27177_01946 [Paraburkholderia fynbosensis]
MSINRKTASPSAKGSAYSLFLTRGLKGVQCAPTSPAVVRTFIDQPLEGAGGAKQQLESDSREIAGLRLLDERFTVIRQAMGVPKSRGPAAADVLTQFVEEMKGSGFVADALTSYRIYGRSALASQHSAA